MIFWLQILFIIALVISVTIIIWYFFWFKTLLILLVIIVLSYFLSEKLFNKEKTSVYEYGLMPSNIEEVSLSLFLDFVSTIDGIPIEETKESLSFLSIKESLTPTSIWGWIGLTFGITSFSLLLFTGYVCYNVQIEQIITPTNSSDLVFSENSNNQILTPTNISDLIFSKNINNQIWLYNNNQILLYNNNQILLGNNNNQIYPGYKGEKPMIFFSEYPSYTAPTPRSIWLEDCVFGSRSAVFGLVDSVEDQIEIGCLVNSLIDQVDTMVEPQIAGPIVEPQIAGPIVEPQIAGPMVEPQIAGPSFVISNVAEPSSVVSTMVEPQVADPSSVDDAVAGPSSVIDSVAGPSSVDDAVAVDDNLYYIDQAEELELNSIDELNWYLTTIKITPKQFLIIKSFIGSIDNYDSVKAYVSWCIKFEELTS